MQKCLDDNGILMLTQLLLQLLLRCLNQLVNECNNSYDCSVGIKPIDGDYSALADEMEANLKLPKLKVGSRVRITKQNNIFSKNQAEKWSRETFVIDLMHN